MDADQVDQELVLDMAANLSNFTGPYFPQMYEMEQDLCCARSTECSLRAIWPRWKSFYDHIGSPVPWTNKTGLGLCNDRDPALIRDKNMYDRKTVDKFFQYLSDNGEASNTLTKGKTFLNTHLKCEHCSRCRNIQSLVTQVTSGWTGEFMDTMLKSSQ